MHLESEFVSLEKPQLAWGIAKDQQATLWWVKA
jgi:hypothetical protein